MEEDYKNILTMRALSNMYDNQGEIIKLLHDWSFARHDHFSKWQIVSQRKIIPRSNSFVLKWQIVGDNESTRRCDIAVLVSLNVKKT